MDQGDLGVESAIVNYVISALDAATKNPGALDLGAMIPRLRDLLLLAEGAVHLIWHGNVLVLGKTHEEVVDALMKGIESDVNR